MPSTRSTNTSATLPDDPVTRYAIAVLEGREIAARFVRQACARHRDDLTRAEAKGLIWYPERAEHAIDFFPDILCLPEDTDNEHEHDDDEREPRPATPFVLQPWQQFIVGSLMGWYAFRINAKGKRREVRRFRVAYIEVAKGSGKALALDTPIATRDGWTTMGAIRVGDVVFDDRGRQTTVLATSNVMENHECYEVVFDDGSVIVADAEHLWFTTRRHWATRDRPSIKRGHPKWAWGQWHDGIRTTKQIAATLRYPNGKYQSANHSVALAGPLATDVTPLPIDPYVFGVWLGDGDSDGARITVADADVELLEHIAACGVTVGARKQSTRTPRYRIGGTVRGSSHESLNATLRRLGLFGQPKYIPAVYLRAAVDQRLALLQGLMDTDGYISAKGDCEFCSVNEALANATHELILSLGIKCSLRKSAATIYGRVVSDRWRLQFHPPADLPVFRLRRKLQYQRVRHTRHALSGERRIVDVRPCASVPVRCIAVDAQSHLYLAGRSMIPTHNTPLCAGLLLYLLISDGERGAQMFTAAVTKDQARIAFTDCEKMVKASPSLRERMQCTVNNLAFPEMASFIRLISAERRGLDGKRVHAAILDEEHEHASPVAYLKVRAGTKGRANALILIPTNSGFDTESICGRHHEYSRQVLDGILTNEAWFAFVAHLDPCPACLAEGKTQPADDCPLCDDWRTEGPHWKKANPNLGVSIQWQYLREQVREAAQIPTQQNMVRRLNFCQWTQQADVWIPIQQWVSCRAVLSLSAFAGRECFIGIDMSDKIDLTAVVLIFPRPLRYPVKREPPPAEDRDAPRGELIGQSRVEPIEVARGATRVEKPVLPPEPPPPPIDAAIDILPMFWMPRNTLQLRAKEDNIPYPEWEKAGHLTAWPGELVDHDAVVDAVIALSSIVQVRGIGVDQAGATALVTRLRRHFGEELVVEVPQSFRMLSEPAKTFEALVASKNVAHDGNPVMTMCINNMATEENNWREIRPIKLSKRKRIDGGVATIDAIHVMQRTAAPTEPSYQIFVAGGR